MTCLSVQRRNIVSIIHDILFDCAYALDLLSAALLKHVSFDVD